MLPLQLQLILDSSISIGSVAATVGESYRICQFGKIYSN